MDTKHTPATPLPLNMAWGLLPEDSAYLIHAANAYPRLIAALVALGAEAHGSADMARPAIGNTNANCLQRRADEARALLVELGEIAPLP